MDFEFVINDMEDFKKRGLSYPYSILRNGKDLYTNMTKEDYIKEGFTILSESEFDKIVEEWENYLCGDWYEITEEFYNNQLNVLPPLFYRDNGFFISEADIGNIHGFYQELNGKYYTSLQRTSSKRSEILEDLKRAISESRIKDGKEV